MGIISIGDLVKNIISIINSPSTSCLIIYTARGAKIPKYARGSWHRHFAVRRFELDDKTIGIETG